MARSGVSEASYSLPDEDHGNFDSTGERQEYAAQHPDGRKISHDACEYDEQSEGRDDPGDG